MRRRHRILMAAGLMAPACAPAPTPAGHKASTGTTSVLHPLEPADEAVQPEPATPSTTGDVPGRTEPVVDATTTTVTITVPTTPRRTSTTFVLPEREDEEVDDETWWRNQPGFVQTGRAALLACIRSYESGGDYGAVSPSGQYLGAYQFDLQTWRSVGGSGNPANAAPAEQDARAWALYESRGLAPWPTPARRCG
jgi:hypothetical protein